MVSSGCSTVRTEKASAEDTHRQECPHDVVGLHAHRQTRIDDVSLAVEQSGEEPPLVSSGCSTVRTEKALAEDTHRRECPHDVVGLHAHKGTMRMSSDGVSLKNVESPYGGGVSPLLGAAGGPPPALFPVVPALLAEGPQLGPWRVAVVRVDETPAGDSSGQDSPCATQNRHRPMDIYELPDSLAHTVVEGGPVGPEVNEPLALLVRDYADPAGQHAVTQNTTSLLEHLLAQPEPSLGGGLVERISDGEPTAHQVPDITLDSRLKEGITYLEHPALGVSLDSGPMEGKSRLEPLEQSILQSSWIARPRNCVIKEKSEWKPVITPASSYTLDSRPMEGITYLDRPALGVSLDSGPTEGASCLEPLEQSVLCSSLAARPVGCAMENVLDWKPLRNPATSYTLDSRPMEGITNLERSALGVSLDSGPTEGAPCLEPLEQSVLVSCTTR